MAPRSESAIPVLRSSLRFNPRPALLYLVCAVSLATFAGCKSSAPATDDASLAKTVQAQLTSDSAVAGQPIQTSVQGGMVTLSGSVANDAQRTLAARDVAGIAGVRTVINNLTVGAPPAQTATVSAPPMPTMEKLKPSPAIGAPPMAARKEHDEKASKTHPAPIERPTQPELKNGPGSYGPTTSAPAPAPAPAPSPSTPPPPPPPSFRNLTVASGSTIPVRVTQTLDSATTQPGTAFSGVVASDIVVDGIVAIPAGSAVSGKVDAVQDAGHFSGNSLLTVSLTGLNRRGDRLPLTTEPYSVEGKGRGKNTVEKTAGGAALGAILGGIFGGGRGAAIGAAAGGGVGAGANAITRGQQVQIESETVVRFHLTSPISVRVRSDDNGPQAPADPTLQRRPNN